MHDFIQVRNARVHNLKNVSLDIASLSVIASACTSVDAVLNICGRDLASHVAAHGCHSRRDPKHHSNRYFNADFATSHATKSHM